VPTATLTPSVCTSAHPFPHLGLIGLFPTLEFSENSQIH
jgi:hypothetical protein